MKIENIRHDFPKSAGYRLDRPKGRNHYIFAHYYGPVTLKLGNTTHEIKPGGCVFVEPGISQYLYSQEPLVHNWLHFHPEPQDFFMQCPFPINEPFYIPHSEKISELFQKIEVEFFSREPYREVMLDACVNEFLVWLYRSMQSPVIPVTVPKAVAAAVTAVRKRVLTQPEKNWDIAQMAAMVPLSTSRFHAVYKAMFGTTPAQDLIESRVDSAKALLRANRSISLKEVAEQLGYNDQYHFIRQFKAVTGQTPGAYRKG